MSFLARTRPALQRAFHSVARPLMVSGYGQNPPSQQSRPIRSQQKNWGQASNSTIEQSAGIDQQAEIDPVAGGTIPNYSGPSIAEKRRGGPVNVEDAESTQMSNTSSEDVATERDSAELYKSGGADSMHTDLNQGFQGLSKQGKKAKLEDVAAFGLPPSQPRRAFSSWDRDESLKEDLKDDAARLKQKASNKMSKAKLAASDVAVDLKEGAQNLWSKTKKAARHAKENVKEVAKEATTPVYARDSNDLYPTSDSANAKRGVTFGASPEVEAERSGASMAEGVNAVRSALFDGPQEMPQGVGKRAKDTTGTPMETGTDRS